MNIMSLSSAITDEINIIVPDESSPNYVPKRYAMALKTPFADSWKRQADSEMQRLISNGFMTPIFSRSEIPDECKDDRGIVKKAI